MTDLKKSFFTNEPVDAKKKLDERVYPYIKALTMAKHSVKITVDVGKRSLSENNLLHLLISKVAEEIEWAGKKRDLEIWKRLLVAAWCRVRGEQIEILPAIDGHGFDLIPARTSKLNKKECADLIEFIYAYGSENGIIWDH